MDSLTRGESTPERTEEAAVAMRLVPDKWRPEKLIKALATYALDADRTEAT